MEAATNESTGAGGNQQPGHDANGERGKEEADAIHRVHAAIVGSLFT